MTFVVQDSVPKDAVRASMESLTTLHPAIEVKLVGGFGNPTPPARCTKATEDGNCKFKHNGDRRLKKPVLTATGPAFARKPRLRCTVHGGECALQSSSNRQFGEGNRLSPPLIQAGMVRDLAV